MNFSSALELLTAGRTIARSHWPVNRKLTHIQDGSSELIVLTEAGRAVEYSPTQQDLLAQDWGYYENDKFSQTPP